MRCLMNCLLEIISPFPTVFQFGYSLYQFKGSADCMPITGVVCQWHPDCMGSNSYITKSALPTLGSLISPDKTKKTNVGLHLFNIM